MSLAPPRVILIATGHNNTAGYQPFPVEPHFEGIQYPRVIDTPDGSRYYDGKPFAELTFRALDPVPFVQAMTLAGVYTLASAPVTVRLPNRDRTLWTDYNGTAVQPEAVNNMRWDVLRYYGVALTIRRLVALT